MRGRRDALGTLLGLLTFLGGILLLLLTFKLAYDMFMVPPEQALNLKKGEQIELGPVGSTVTGLLVRVLLLIVMGVVGSFVSNRGVHMYTESRGAVVKTEVETVTREVPAKESE